MKDLSTYLNDHLAGSVGALEMLDEMIESHKGKPLAPFLETLRQDIEADQSELQQLIARLGEEESAVRQAGAWVAEKFSRVKLRLGDEGEPNLPLLQSFESLSLGITGKRSLWRTLAALAEQASALQGIDFARLQKRAVDQFERVEFQGFAVARAIFAPELEAPKN